MAKSKEGQTSKGQRPNVNRKILNAVRKERTELDRIKTLANLDLILVQVMKSLLPRLVYTTK